MTAEIERVSDAHPYRHVEVVQECLACEKRRRRSEDLSKRGLASLGILVGGVPSAAWLYHFAGEYFLGYLSAVGAILMSVATVVGLVAVWIDTEF